MSSHKMQIACASTRNGAVIFFVVHRLLVARIFCAAPLVDVEPDAAVPRFRYFISRSEEARMCSHPAVRVQLERSRLAVPSQSICILAHCRQHSCRVRRISRLMPIDCPHQEPLAPCCAMRNLSSSAGVEYDSAPRSVFGVEGWISA